MLKRKPFLSFLIVTAVSILLSVTFILFIAAINWFTTFLLHGR